MNIAPSSHTHILFARWSGVMITALLLYVQQRPVDFWWVWAVALMLTATITIAIQPITRLLLRHPLLIGVDLVCGAGMIVITGGWTSPFVPAVCLLVIIPAMLFGLRGGVLAGLLMGLLNATLLFLHGSWTSDVPVHWIAQSGLFGGPILCGVLFSFLRPGHDHRGAVIQTTDDVTTPLRSLPAWVGGVVRRAVPLLPRVYEVIRPGREVRQSASPRRTDELRVALYAPMPDGEQLLDHIRALASLFEQNTQIPVRCVILGRPKPIQYLHTDTMRRIIIESLLNVEQHARAKSVSVLVRFDARTVIVLIQDDGTGLPNTGIRRAGLHSLQMLIYRVAEVGGRLDVFPTPAGGVAVRATYPLSIEEVIV